MNNAFLPKIFQTCSHNWYNMYSAIICGNYLCMFTEKIVIYKDCKKEKKEQTCSDVCKNNYHKVMLYVTEHYLNYPRLYSQPCQLNFVIVALARQCIHVIKFGGYLLYLLDFILTKKLFKYRFTFLVPLPWIRRHLIGIMINALVPT